MTERGDVITSTARPRLLLHGVAAGLGGGVIWWVVETVTNHALGGVIPPEAAAQMLGLDLGLGAVAGALLGTALALIGRCASAAVLALAVTAGYGLIRVYEPPGLRGEAVFVVAAAVATVLGLRIAGRARYGWVAFLHLTLLTTATTAIGKALLSEAESSYFGLEEPTGVRLVLLLVGLPLVGLALDRLLGLALRRHGLRFAAELAAAALAMAIWGRPQSTAPIDETTQAAVQPRAQAPDVILVSLDTTRADHMSTYGYARETSPNLTALARDALNFTQARSPAQWTVPGHASMFTGMYPSRHGAHYAGGWGAAPVIAGRKRVFPLGEDKVTLAEVLRDQGYRTAGFAANFANLYRGFGMAQGFQHYEDKPGLLLRPVPHAVRFAQRFVPTFMKKPFRSAGELTTTALAWMDGGPPGQPAFVFLNFLEPHHWLAAPPFDRWSRDLPHADRLAQKGLFTHRIPAGLTPEEQVFVAANYDGQIASMDVALGELFAGLKARGRYENALIIVTADHGELLGEHDQVGHGGRMMYEGLLHIPMVVKFPGSARPRGEVSEPVQLVDVLPTVLAVLNVPVPAGVQGEPLQHVTHATIAEEHINPEFVAYYGAVYNRALRVLYDGPYKLITSSRGEHMLFDLDHDRDEANDLASLEPARVATMERKLDATMRDMETKVAGR